MPTIKTTVDDDTYAALVKMRRAEGVPSVSALFLKKCDQYTDENEAKVIVKRAFALANGRPYEEPFKLQDLFPSDKWENFGKVARLRAGKMFKAEVDAARSGIRADKKSSSNHQYYVRAEER